MLNFYNQGVDRWITRKEIRERDPELAATEIKGADQLFPLLTQMPLEDAGTEPATPPAKSGDKVTLVKSKKKVAKDLKYSVAYARKYKQAFDKVLKKQEKTVLGNITHLKGKGIADDLLDMGDEDQAFMDELGPVLTALTLQQGQIALEFSGSDAKYQQSQKLKAAIAASTKKMSQNFDSETLDQLNATLSEGLGASESISELSDRVASVYDQASSWRSDRVARTEAQSASNAATLDAYQQNPVVVSMTWYANPGACEYCAELDGTTVGTEEIFVAQGDSVDVGDDSFQADYGDIETPPLHPNCSCTIVPETDSGDSSDFSDNSDSGDGGDGGDE